MNNELCREFLDEITKNSLVITDEQRKDPMFILTDAEAIHKEYLASLDVLRKHYLADDVSLEMNIVLLWVLLLRSPGMARYVNFIFKQVEEAESAQG